MQRQIDAISIMMMNDDIQDNEIWEFIIDKKIPLDAAGRDGRTLLIHAIAYNRIYIVGELLKENVDISIKDNQGFTPLLAAVHQGNYAIAKELIELGADVTAVDNWGNNALLRVRSDDKEMAKLLLDNHCDPSRKNNFGVSAYDIFRNDDAVSDLLNRSREN